MKNNYIKALQRLQERFEWAEKKGVSDRTKRENQIILKSLSDYFEQTEKRELDLFQAYSSILDKFRKRGYFIQMHAYSDYVLNWIDNANIDFLESEVEYRKRNRRPLMPDSLLSWIDLEANQRIVINKALADIQDYKTYNEFKGRSSPQNDYSSILKGHTVTEPNLSKQIKLHSFRYE